MCEDNWTKKETERQDFVDNAICELIYDLGPEWLVFNWDIELIGRIRDVVQEILVDDLKVMTEQEFYPYRERVLEPQPESESFVISDKFGEMSRKVDESVSSLDANEFGDLVGELFGGTCHYIGEYKYSFTPNSLYNGGLDDIKEE